MNKKLAMMLITIGVINCGSFGTFVKNEDLNQIVEKKSTRSDVKSILGSPISTETKDDLTIYNYSGCKSNGLYWFPIFGSLLGSYECNTGSIIFDKDGKVKDKAFNYTKSGLW